MHQLLFRPYALRPRALAALAVALVALIATAASAQAAPVRQIQLNAIKGPGNQNLQVGSCADQLGGRQRWMFRTGSVGNTGVQIQNVATSRVVMHFISDFTDFDVEALPKSLGDSFPNSSEWRLPRIGDI
jgi:hypothetical protein